MTQPSATPATATVETADRAVSTNHGLDIGRYGPPLRFKEFLSIHGRYARPIRKTTDRISTYNADGITGRPIEFSNCSLLTTNSFIIPLEFHFAVGGVKRNLVGGGARDDMTAINSVA